MTRGEDVRSPAPPTAAAAAAAARGGTVATAMAPPRVGEGRWVRAMGGMAASGVAPAAAGLCDARRREVSCRLCSMRSRLDFVWPPKTKTTNWVLEGQGG